MNMTPEQDATDLYDKNQSTAFYEERYQQGYMDDWPPEKKRRVLEIIQRLPLPEHGDALDFGCGNGVLTEVVRQALPGWNIYGTDMSATAVASANQRYPGCIFFEPGDEQHGERTFDFLFTNHVIEHVYDLDEVMQEISALLKPSSSMLHFLPCGNAGSFEHQVCQLRTDGSDSKFGNRFFYEDEGHVRRLTSKEFINICESFGFELAQEFYTNQYHGALEWITGSSIRFIRTFSDTDKAIDGAARKRLRKIRKKILILGLLRSPVRMLSQRKNKQERSLLDKLFYLIILALYPLSALVDNHMKQKSDKEWRQQSKQPEASGMCLFLKRT